MSEVQIPQSLYVLREEFGKVADSLDSRMIALPKYINREYDLFELTRVHIDNNAERVTGITDLLNNDLASMSDKTTEDVYRIIRRFREEIDGLIDGYDEVRRLLPHEEDFEPWKLLIEIYHDTLCQYRRWFVEMLEKLDELLSTETDRNNDGQRNSTVEIHLDVRAPNAMVRLQRWLERESKRINANVQSTRKTPF